MDEKILKKIKTTCPFPLLKYSVNITYNEVKKPSGIAYILLELIQKSKNSDETIHNVLLRFGIPADLHYIFAKEIYVLMNTDILEKTFNGLSDTNHLQFAKIGDLKLTPKGNKMFKDGAIPTGEEKNVIKDIYFNPVTRKFDIECSSSYSPLDSSFLGSDFVDHIDIDISGMEDYINANVTKFGLKVEERVVSFVADEPERMQIRKEDALTIIIKLDDVEFKFESSDETVFFNKYYSASLMSKGMLFKDKYKFISNQEEINIPTVTFKELGDISNVYIPYDAQKQASISCKVFLNRNRFNFNGSASAHKVDLENSISLLNLIDENAEFSLIHRNRLSYYCPYNVKIPCSQLNGDFEIQLLIEKQASDEQFNKILLKLYEIYSPEPFSQEIGKIILFIIESLDNSKYFEDYINKQFDKLTSYDEKINLLLQMNESFINNPNWYQYCSEFGNKLMNNSISEIKLDNTKYKNIILLQLKNLLKIDDIDYIKMFVKPIINEDPDVVFQALEYAKFDINQILSVVNVMENYLDKVLSNETIYADTSLADKFKIININLWKLNDMLGIENYSKYTLNDNYNVDEFFNIYSTLSQTIESIAKYAKFAQNKFDELIKYMKIYEPIQEILSIEKESSSHPNHITIEYINDNIEKGKYKNAICDLFVKLQYDLRKMFNDPTLVDAYSLINYALDEKVINKNEYSSIQKMRKVRNGLQHPEREQINFTKAEIEEWRNIVFRVGGSNNESSS